MNDRLFNENQIGGTSKCLNYYGKNLKSLPSYENQEYLEEINISYNLLNELKGIESFQNLKVLKASQNQLTDFSGIILLRKLEILDLGYNCLTEIPEKVNCLLCLKSLSIRNNHISSKISIERLRPLKNLRTVDFRENPVSSIENYHFLINFNVPRINTLDGKKVELNENKENLHTGKTLNFNKKKEQNSSPLDSAKDNYYIGDLTRKEKMLENSKPKQLKDFSWNDIEDNQISSILEKKSLTMDQSNIFIQRINNQIVSPTFVNKSLDFENVLQKRGISQANAQSQASKEQSIQPSISNEEDSENTPRMVQPEALFEKVHLLDAELEDQRKILVALVYQKEEVIREFLESDDQETCNKDYLCALLMVSEVLGKIKTFLGGYKDHLHRIEEILSSFAADNKRIEEIFQTEMGINVSDYKNVMNEKYGDAFKQIESNENDVKRIIVEILQSIIEAKAQGSSFNDFGSNSLLAIDDINRVFQTFNISYVKRRQVSADLRKILEEYLENIFKSHENTNAREDDEEEESMGSVSFEYTKNLSNNSLQCESSVVGKRITNQDAKRTDLVDKNRNNEIWVQQGNGNDLVVPKCKNCLENSKTIDALKAEIESHKEMAEFKQKEEETYRSKKSEEEKEKYNELLQNYTSRYVEFEEEKKQLVNLIQNNYQIQLNGIEEEKQRLRQLIFTLHGSIDGVNSSSRIESTLQDIKNLLVRGKKGFQEIVSLNQARLIEELLSEKRRLEDEIRVILENFQTKMSDCGAYNLNQIPESTVPKKDKEVQVDPPNDLQEIFYNEASGTKSQILTRDSRGIFSLKKSEEPAFADLETKRMQSNLSTVRSESSLRLRMSLTDRVKALDQINFRKKKEESSPINIRKRTMTSNQKNSSRISCEYFGNKVEQPDGAVYWSGKNNKSTNRTPATFKGQTATIENNDLITEEKKSRMEKSRSFCNIDEMIIGEIISRNNINKAQKSLYNTCVHLKNYTSLSSKKATQEKGSSTIIAHLNNYKRILAKGKY